MSFNGLSDAEAERLALLAEELAEAIQMIGKTLRHGYDSCSPNDPTETVNRELLVQELGDVQAAIDLMVDAGDVRRALIDMARADKTVRVRRYLHHQEEAKRAETEKA